jgi:hypothetical protein
MKRRRGQEPDRSSAYPPASNPPKEVPRSLGTNGAGCAIEELKEAGTESKARCNFAWTFGRACDRAAISDLTRLLWYRP